MYFFFYFILYRNLIAFDITEEFLNQITTLPQLEEL